MKECPLCKTQFEPSNLHKNYCCKEHSKEYRRTFKQASWSAKYASKSPKTFLGRLLTKDRYNREEISIEYLLSLWNGQKGLCAISKVPMTHLHGEGNLDTNISIDRINPEEGYIEGNIQLVCRVVNHMKWLNDIPRLSWWCKQILEAN